MFRLEFVFKTMFEICSKLYSKPCSNPYSKPCSKPCSKNKKIANKNMSFLQITDPKKRDFIVNEFLKTRQKIQQNVLSERVGDLSKQYELSKLFKPVTDMQTDLKGLVSELKPIREGMKHLPKAVTFPQYPCITAYDDDGEEEGKAVIGNIAQQYL